MSYSGDAAEQVVRMSLEGAEVAARITGQGAKQVALLLYAVLKDQKKTKGKARLTSMLRTGKELKVFAVEDKDLVKFSRAAKQYGVLYCVLKDRDAKDGLTDVMVRAEDAIMANPSKEEQQNPMEARTTRSPQSGSFSKPSGSPTAQRDRGAESNETCARPSVRQKMREIRAELERESAARAKTQQPLEHKAPKRKQKRKER